MRNESIYRYVKEICAEQLNKCGSIQGVTTEEIAERVSMQRTNVARELSKLVAEGSVSKKMGRPVLYFVSDVGKAEKKKGIFDSMIGREASLKSAIVMAKAAIVYPPRGLHTLIVGETGVGKSFFAKAMFKYAEEMNCSIKKGHFATFNCADYANNPNLLISYLFGVKKGAYTGASCDREGIIEKARDGILFLDEIHRLPAEGQEMLFTLIDEGKYTPLGETAEKTIDLMIICATTENIESSLLKTFTRRIPVVISLPALKDRTPEERMELIKDFLGQESQRTKRKINIDEDALTALLNYECPNNIGELKSHIQIACAKAFLRSMFSEDSLKIKLDDFPEEVKAGLLISGKVKREYTDFISSEKTEDDGSIIEDKYNMSSNLYEFIEKRTESLKKQGVEESIIKNRISDEAGRYINSYLSSISLINKEECVKLIVNSDLYDLLNNFMYLAEYKLKRKISRNTFIGLLIHIDTFIGRIREKRIVTNPKIDEIRKKYSEEFKLSMKLVEKLEDKYDISIPIDEIGFIAMFFAADVEERKPRVGVIVAMHGKDTATSMVEVSKQLLNTSHGVSFDMPLSMKPEDALTKIEDLAKAQNEGKGVLLLVDMGSLKLFDKIIKNDTGIEVKSVDMVTTPIVIEAIRKAIMYEDIDSIIKDVDLKSRYLGSSIGQSIIQKKDVIITACSTGHGTAEKIKELVYSRYDRDKYEVINLSIKDKEQFENAILNIKKDSNIIAIISSFHIQIPGIEYIPLDEFMNNFIKEDFQRDVKEREVLENIKIIYRDYMELKDADYIVNKFMETLCGLNAIFNIEMDMEKLNGLLMHVGSLIQAVINKEDTPKCSGMDIIMSRYEDIFSYLKDDMGEIEKKLNIKFSDDDIGNIVEILINL